MTQPHPEPISRTAQPASRQPRRVRHELRFRRLEVMAREQLTPHMLLITVGGPELEGFASLGFDDHVKLFFPDEQTGELHMPDVGPEGQIVWPQGPRSLARDYTPLSHDPQAKTLQLAFALHEAGPATRWAQNAKVGDIVGAGGPRGSFILSADFDGYVMIGDDTALPAIGRRLAELPDGAPVLVLAEVDDPQSIMNWPERPNTTVRWVYRQGQPAQQPDRLLAALANKGADVPFPAGDAHIWIAAESGVAKALRTYFVNERGHSPKWIKASGYWRAGEAGAHDEHGADE